MIRPAFRRAVWAVVSMAAIGVAANSPAAAQTLSFSKALPPFAAQTPADAKWTAVRGLSPRSKVEVELYDAPSIRGRAVTATPDSMTIATDSGEKRLERSAIKRVRVPSPGRRLMYGAIGLSGGLIGGFFVCPSCANEGAPGVQSGAMAIGGGLGSLAFLASPYRTVYQGPPR